MDILSEIRQLQNDILKYRRNDTGRAYELCEELLALSNQAGNDDGVAFAQYYMCDVSATNADFDTLIKKITSLLPLFHENGFYNYEIKSYNLLGISFDNKYETFLALENYQKALTLAKEYSFPLLEALTNCNIGCIFSRLEDNVTARTYFEASFNVLEMLEEDDMIRNYKSLINTNLAITMILLDEYDLARDYFNNISSLEDDTVSVNSTYIVVKASLLLHDGAVEEARAYAREGVETLLNSYSIYDTLDSFINVYNLLIALEEYELLERYFVASLDYTKEKKLFLFRRDIFEIYLEYLREHGSETTLDRACKEYYEMVSKFETAENKSTAKGIKLKLSMLEATAGKEAALAQNSALSQMSQMDVLTHLPNRYKYDSSVSYYFSRAQKERKNFCYVIMDVDCFKQYNDTYGHLKGDSCLWHIANVLRGEITNDVIFFRYGGDEFVGIYFGKTDDYVRSSIKRLERNIKALGLEHKASLKKEKNVSLTIGYVNKLPSATDKAIDLISEADMILYKNKAAWKQKEYSIHKS